MFYFLLEDRYGSYESYLDLQRNPGCVAIDCPFVWWEEDRGDYGSVLARYPICIGFEKEKDCWDAEEQYMEGGASECRVYKAEMRKRAEAEGTVPEETTS